MISLVHIIKKYYRLVFGGAFLLYLVFVLNATYIVYNVLINNALTVASLGNILFKKTANDIEEKVSLSKDIFEDIEQKYKTKILVNTAQIKQYISAKYLLKYDIAFISEKGLIIETTNPNERNLDLSQFPDCRKSFENAKKTGELQIDYPVLNSDYKSFYIYLLKYIPEKRLFLQLGYNIMIFSEILASLTSLDLKSGSHFNLSVYFIYLEKDSMIIRLFGDDDSFDENTAKNILNKINKTYLTKKFNEIRLYAVIGQNKGYSILYILHIKPLSKGVILGWLSFNLLFLTLFSLLYKKIIFLVKKEIENPLKDMRNCVNDSKPYKYMGNIIELKELAETYEYHLEKIKTRDFLKEVLKAQEQERERIARDIHDIVIQNLNYILIKLKQTDQKELADLLKSQIEDLRDMVIDGDVVIFKKMGLEKYFEMLISDYSQNNQHIKFHYENSFHNFNYFEKYEQINILRIVRELVTNAIKHSKGSNIGLKFYEKNSQLFIQIKDDGVGFEPISIDIKKSFGLNSVYERVFILGGKIDIKSDKSGTNILITVPLKK